MIHKAIPTLSTRLLTEPFALIRAERSELAKEHQQEQREHLLRYLWDGDYEIHAVRFVHPTESKIYSFAGYLVFGIPPYAARNLARLFEQPVILGYHTQSAGTMRHRHVTMVEEGDYTRPLKPNPTMIPGSNTTRDHIVTSYGGRFKRFTFEQ
jgi:hypothetical protein